MRILDIARLRDQLQDRAVAILANGPSLRPHWSHLKSSDDAENLDAFGVNQAWRVFDHATYPTWHVAMDKAQYEMAPEFYGEMHKRGGLFSGSDWGIGHGLGTMPPTAGWSRDPLMAGVCVSQNGIGSITYAALQLVAWMGYGRIWMCGLDLGGPKFTGEPAGNVAAQDSLFRLTPAHVRAKVRVFEPTNCTAFQTVGID